MSEKNKQDVLLEVKDLKKYYTNEKGFLRKTIEYVKAVDGVSLNIYKGETLGLVGESGCGKSTFGKTIVRLFEPNQGSINYQFDNGFQNIFKLDKKESHAARKKIQMIFQDPYSSLNPTKTVEEAFHEPMKVHGIKDPNERIKTMIKLLRAVNLRPEYIYRYPHEFSGGQLQRISIARALCVNPELVVCDEPVSALDVSIQAQVLNLMKDLQEELNLTYLFIAHDLSVVEYMSDRIAVMYLGKIVELAEAKELYNNYLHPYTQALLSAVPVPTITDKKKRIVLEGDVPSPVNPPKGCRFHGRCQYCSEICKEKEPELKPYPDNLDHFVACHFPSQWRKNRMNTNKK